MSTHNILALLQWENTAMYTTHTHTHFTVAHYPSQFSLLVLLCQPSQSGVGRLHTVLLHLGYDGTSHLIRVGLGTSNLHT